MQTLFIDTGFHNVHDIHEKSWAVITAIVNVSSSCVSKKQTPPVYVVARPVASCFCLGKTWKQNPLSLCTCGVFSLGTVIMQGFGFCHCAP